VVHEQRESVIRSVDYYALNPVRQPDLRKRFQQGGLGLYIMSQYDPVVVKRAEAVIKDMLSKNGRPDATVRALVRDVPPDSVALTFVVVEGPQVNQRHDA
jgi:outer membrane protein insertion porin family